MSGTTDVVKGRLKEAAGVLTGNDEMRARGKKDQAVGHVKQAAEKGVRKAKDSAREFVDRAKDAAQKAVDKAKDNE
jgi:uncharacterized protein YjbJ (UPF0337 family)